MAPFHIVGIDGRLYSRLIPTQGDRGEVAYILSSTYSLVENAPRFIYSSVNSNQLAITENGQLYDLFQRRTFEVYDPERGVPYPFTKVLTHRSHTRALNDEVMVDLKYNGKLGYEIYQCWKIADMTIISDKSEVEGIVSTEQEAIFSEVYDPAAMDMGPLLINIDETKKVISDDPRILDMIKITDPNYNLTVYLLLDDGTLRYHPEIRDGNYPCIDTWNSIQVSESDQEPIPSESDNPKYRFVKLGDYHAVANRSGEIWIIDQVNKLKQLDLPLDVFRVVKKSTKSARFE